MNALNINSCLSHISPHYQPALLSLWFDLCPATPQNSILICRHHLSTSYVLLFKNHYPLLSIFSTLPLESTSWIIPRALSACYNLCLTVSLSWSCHHRFHQRHHFHHIYHPFSLSIQTQNTPFPQIISTTSSNHRSPLDGLHGYPARSLAVCFSLFSDKQFLIFLEERSRFSGATRLTILPNLFFLVSYFFYLRFIQDRWTAFNQTFHADSRWAGIENVESNFWNL